jgi:hypothetical protein
VPESEIQPVAADLLDAAATRRAVADLQPTHVFYCTWQRRPTEAENCVVNAAMMTNVLDPLVVTGDLAHVALVTGLKHYLGPFEAAPYPGHAQPLAERIAEAGPVWDRIVAKHNLVPTKLEELASWWHTDGDLGRPTETFADMTKSRAFGCTVAQDTRRSFLDLFDRLRAERIIPPLG